MCILFYWWLDKITKILIWFFSNVLTGFGIKIKVLMVKQNIYLLLQIVIAINLSYEMHNLSCRHKKIKINSKKNN